MADDLVEDLLGEIALGRRRRRGRGRLARRIAGLAGAGLCAVGAVHVAGRADLAAIPAFHACAVATLGFLGCFWLWNVALGRRGRWPAIGFALAFAGLFVTRIAFGP